MKKLFLALIICISANLVAQPQADIPSRRTARTDAGIIGQTCRNNRQCMPGQSCQNGYCNWINIPGKSDVMVATALARSASAPSLGMVSYETLT